jgi:hypothetical protein
MLGGRDSCDAMILAQNEMIKLERDYYKEESIKFAFLIFVLSFATLLAATFYYKVMNV